MSSLKHLDFSGVIIGNHIDWLHPINMLPSLRTLNLASCDINIPPIKFINFTSLKSLDLSFNGINSTIPVWLSNFTGLVHLTLQRNYFHDQIPDSIGNLISLASIDLSFNQLSGPIPVSIGNLSSLSSIDLSFNQLSGPIPPSLGGLSSLRELLIFSNKLNGSIPESIGLLTRLQLLYFPLNQLRGSIPESIGLLTRLERLCLFSNQLSGVVSEIHFTKLNHLTELWLSDNLLTFNVIPHWIPPFQLKSFSAISCNIGPQFPNWLQTQTNLQNLEASNSGIRDSMPKWFENISSHIAYLDFSDNHIDENLPRITNPGIEIVNLGKNRFSGSIPAYLCELLSMQKLDLSNNNLSGVLPECLGNLIQLQVIDLTNNTITGDVPNSLGSLSYLEILHLYNNKFEGSLPAALQNLTNLVTFDLGNNQLTGNIPSWIGKRLSKLKVLNLQSNRLMGKIPLELCQNNALQHLNLANNNITGMIPRCFYNLTGMIRSNFDFNSKYKYKDEGYEENIEASTKGIELRYTKTIGFLVSLDLSSNKIIGEIPDVLMNLTSLTNLNLSRNLLTGHISERIGSLESMESLDLSMNKLSGRIPPSLASLDFLSYLNLSFNNLSGPIPVGNHLQTLGDPSTVYEGNTELCGPSLPRSCKENNLPSAHIAKDEAKDISQGCSWFYAGVIPGFVVGFIGFIGSLHFIRIWRVTYFQMIENVYTCLVIIFIVALARLRRRIF